MHFFEPLRLKKVFVIKVAGVKNLQPFSFG